uniref:MALT paracaspase 2 n=1 Tax=Callorhinchus milii TaxID=7868 RepID=A0A4W3GPC7_CALMI
MPDALPLKPAPLARLHSPELDPALLPSSLGWKCTDEESSRSHGTIEPEKGMDQCSLKVLEPVGSPGRSFLQILADRGCTVWYLLSCLDRMDHREAVGLPAAVCITVQPESRDVVVGERVVLYCGAVGASGLSYQWFQGSREVKRSTFTVCMGYGVCMGVCVYGVCMRVCVYGVCACMGWVCVDWVFRKLGYVCSLRILVHPNSLRLQEGQHMSLQCSATGTPPPQYQWFRNNQSIPDATESSLKVTGVTTADRGVYCCRVYNLYQQVLSREAHVEIGKVSPEIDWQPPADCTPWFLSPATDKVALLMGNMNYQHHKQLRAPMVDVHELTNLLRQLDFKVVSLLDLSRREMQKAVNEFLLLLDKGVYGLLYYAGHGYENYGNSFMVPIDAPDSYTSEHCLCVQGILQRMQDKQTRLNVFLLDMCRKRNLHDGIIPRLEAFRVTANIVFGYATCLDAEAYEISHGNRSNGIFISFLKKRLLEDEKITVLLDKVAEDMGTYELTKGKQALEIRSSLSERRALTDHIQQFNSCDKSSARNLQWAKAHELPESRFVTFDCGVSVRLGFAAEFSNIMMIYTQIVQIPDGILHCEATLTDFSEDLDVDIKQTNKDCPEETGSVLFTFRNFDCADRCLYTRLSKLQKLRKELRFCVCLQYCYQGLLESVVEKQMVDVGKPLVAKLNLHDSHALNDYFYLHGPLRNSSSDPSTSNSLYHHRSALSPFHHYYFGHFSSECSSLVYPKLQIPIPRPLAFLRPHCDESHCTVFSSISLLPEPQNYGNSSFLQSSSSLHSTGLLTCTTAFIL